MTIYLKGPLEQGLVTRMLCTVGKIVHLSLLDVAEILCVSKVCVLYYIVMGRRLCPTVF